MATSYIIPPQQALTFDSAPTSGSNNPVKSGGVYTTAGNLAAGMAILANNNTHAAIASGQYVYVRGHGTLAEGLYTANAAIAANATLNASKLTAVSGGGLNALYNGAGAYHAVNISAVSGIGTSSLFAHRSGRVITLNGYFTFENAPGADSVTFATIACPPPDALRVPCALSDRAYNPPTGIGYLGVDTSGNVYLKAPSGNTSKNMYVSCSWVYTGTL